MKKTNILTRTDPDFNKFLKNMKLERIKNEIDNRVRSDRELTKMIMNCPSFPDIKKELARIPTKKDMRKITGRDFI